MRWAWVGAIAGSLLLPVIAYLVPLVFREAGAPLSIELLALQGVEAPVVGAVPAAPSGGFELMAWLTSANALFAVVWVTTPSYLPTLLEQPLGRKMIMGASVMMVVGVFWIRKIIRIEV